MKSTWNSSHCVWSTRIRYWTMPALLVCLLTLICESSSLRVHDLCQWETFNATCPPNHVVVIRSATYGRMKLGRCLDRDYGYLSCHANVQRYVDALCSGRRTCELPLPDNYLDNVPRHCPGDLEAYLEVSYECVEVVTARMSSCNSEGRVQVAPSSGYLSNAIAEVTRVGTESCPWYIRGLQGQKVTLTLWDFGLWQEGQTGHRPLSPEQTGICHIYARIRESGGSSGVTLCGGEDREKMVYMSESSQVEIDFTLSNTGKPAAYFLLEYRIGGCGNDFPAPYVMERNGEAMLVSCPSSGGTWQMTCVEDVWHGTLGNCTEAVAGWGLTDILGSTMGLPQGIWLVLVLVIACIIAAVIMCVGVTIIKRRTRPRRIPDSGFVPVRTEEEKYQSQFASQPFQPHHSSLQQQQPLPPQPRGQYCPKEQYPMLAKSDRPAMEREGDYTTTLHRRLAVPPPLMAANRSISPPDIYPVTMGINFTSPPGGPLPVTSPADACPIHGGQYGDRPLSTFGPAVDHIYESPNFQRKHYHGKDGKPLGEGPYYHELEPDLDDEIPLPRVIQDEETASTISPSDSV